MDVFKPQLLLKRAVNIKAIVTPRWKDEVQQQLQAQINQIDSQLQLDMQGQRAISEQSLQTPGPQTLQQIDNIQLQVNQKKSELLEEKNQSLQNLQQVQLLDFDQEVNLSQMEGFSALNWAIT